MRRFQAPTSIAVSEPALSRPRPTTWRQVIATKLKKLLNRELVSLDEGLTLGKPIDILIDPEQHQIAVIVLSRGPVPETTVVVHGSAVQSYATDTLAIRSVSALRLAAHDAEARELIRRGLQLRGHTVLSGAGAKLGRIRSVLIDENGHVAEYRFRRGVFGFLRPARRVKPADLRASGGHVAVMWPSAEEDSSTPPIDDDASAPEHSNGSAKTDADQDPET